MEGYNRQCLGVYGAPWRGGVVICRVRKPVILVRLWLGREVPEVPIEVRSSPDNRHSGGKVRFTPDSVAKLRPRKIRATLIRRHTLLGKNESLHP